MIIFLYLSRGCYPSRRSNRVTWQGSITREAKESYLPTWDVVSVASDIAGAGTALAGLILVYLGAVAVRFETLALHEIFTVDMRGGHSAA